MSVEQREASVEADTEIREDKLERRETELADLEEKLANKESELATYVQQIQSQLKDRESTWWNKVTGDPDSEEAA
jgi:chromosome segregation ATPase